MSAFEKIVSAIKEFGYPYEPDIYRGEKKKYFTFNYADERATLFADDSIEVVVASVQIHFFLPYRENFISEKNRISKALFKEGFTYPEVTILKENDTRHIIFECDIEEEE